MEIIKEIFDYVVLIKKLAITIILKLIVKL